MCSDDSTGDDDAAAIFFLAEMRVFLSSAKHSEYGM